MMAVSMSACSSSPMPPTNRAWLPSPTIQENTRDELSEQPPAVFSTQYLHATHVVVYTYKQQSFMT